MELEVCRPNSNDVADFLQGAPNKCMFGTTGGQRALPALIAPIHAGPWKKHVYQTMVPLRPGVKQHGSIEWLLANGSAQCRLLSPNPPQNIKADVRA